LEAQVDHLTETPWSGEIVTFVLLASPDGLVKRGRWNTYGVDLNRNLLADNRSNQCRFDTEALSERETRPCAH